MLSTNDKIRRRIRILAAVILIPIMLGLIARFYYVQVIDHEFYLQEARKRYTTTRVTTGKRGEIFDVHGNLLVSNSPCVSITCDPFNLTGDAQRRKLAFILAKHLDDTYDSFYRKLNPVRQRRGRDGKLLYRPDGSPDLVPNRYAMIDRNTSLQAAAKIKEQTKLNKIYALVYKDSYMLSLIHI